MANKRKLTEAEKRRLDNFNILCDELTKQGYIKKDLTANHLAANTLGPLLGLLVALPFALILFLISPDSFLIGDNYFKNYLVYLVLFLILIVVHELIHGITFASFTKEKFKNIEFGIIWKSLNPYCTCTKPLKQNEYILGLIMPCIILGIIPCLLSLISKNAWFLFMGILQTSAAGGDLFILNLILKNKNNLDSLYLDHPTDIGLVKFEK